MILQLADELEHLQRIETKIGEELAVGGWSDGTSAQVLQNPDNL
jgi:hypothetical protein